MDKIQTSLEKIIFLISSFKEGSWAWTDAEIARVIPITEAIIIARIKKWNQIEPPITAKDMLAIRKFLYMITGREGIITEPPSTWGILNQQDLGIHYKVVYLCTNPEIGFDPDAERLAIKICDFKSDDPTILEIQTYLSVALSYCKNNPQVKSQTLKTPSPFTSNPKRQKKLQITPTESSGKYSSPLSKTMQFFKSSIIPQIKEKEKEKEKIGLGEKEKSVIQFHDDDEGEDEESNKDYEVEQDDQEISEEDDPRQVPEPFTPECRYKSRPYSGYETKLEEFIYCSARPDETLSYRTELRTIHGLVMSNHLSVATLNKMLREGCSSEEIWKVIDKEIIIPDTMSLICQIGEASVKMSYMYQGLLGHVATQLTKEIASSITIPPNQQEFITKAIRDLKEVVTEERAQRLATGKEEYINPPEPIFTLPPSQPLRIQQPTQQVETTVRRGLVFKD